MPWFQQLCRRAGLALHGVMHSTSGGGKRLEELRRSVKEEKVSETVTLRRTTIEEVEITPGNPAGNKTADAP